MTMMVHASASSLCHAMLIVNQVPKHDQVSEIRQYNVIHLLRCSLIGSLHVLLDNHLFRAIFMSLARSTR